MKNITVDDEFENELVRRKIFFKEKYDVEIYGTRITKAIAQLLKANIIFPLNDDGLIDVLQVKKNNKLKNTQIIFKMNLPISRLDNSNTNKITLTQN